jgi:hypothetical protein
MQDVAIPDSFDIAILVLCSPTVVDSSRYFLEHEEKKIRAWNQTTKKLGVGPYRKNKYTGRTPF